MKNWLNRDMLVGVRLGLMKYGVKITIFENRCFLRQMLIKNLVVEFLVTNIVLLQTLKINVYSAHWSPFNIRV